MRSYQNVGNITIEKQNQIFNQEIKNGEFVLWNWKQNKKQSYLVGIRNYWNKKGNLEKSKIKLPIKRESKYSLSFMKETTQGNIYLFFENKNQQKAMYLTAQADGTITQTGTFDLKTLGNKKQYSLDDMKIIKNNQLAILYSIINNKGKTKKKVLFLNTKNGNISYEKTTIEWKENTNKFLQNSFQWENKFLYSMQSSKILILDFEKQKKDNKNSRTIPELFYLYGKKNDISF